MPDRDTPDSRGRDEPAPAPAARAVWDPITRYKRLLELNNAIVNQTTRESLFRSLAEAIRRIVFYDRLSINIYDSASNSLSYFAMAEGIAIKAMDDSPRPLDTAPISRAVITTRRPMVIPDMAEFDHWDTVRLMMGAGLKATMAFPLLVRGNVVGSLNFSFKEAPENVEEVSVFLTELSGQVALAVDNMLAHVKLVHLNASLEQQKRYLVRNTDLQYHPDNFYYSNPAMREIIRQLEIVARSDESVLVTGETGTGKDHIARYLHHLSARSDALFVKISCPALSPTLFESELFGHAKGAFTGADSKRVGRFEMAHGGTVFLDEIGELPVQLQAKLLQVLQDRRFERVGDSRPVDVDFRIVAATNSDLDRAIQEKTFRSDLFYRLNTISFHIPPLRERIDEIEPLVRRLTDAQSEVMHRAPPAFAPEAIEALERHSWPGNVRELRNVINRLIIVSSGKTVTAREIEPLLNIRQTEPDPAPVGLAEAERAHLVRILTMTRGLVGGKSGAAALLKVPKSTLQYKLRKHGLRPNDYR